MTYIFNICYCLTLYLFFYNRVYLYKLMDKDFNNWTFREDIDYRKNIINEYFIFGVWMRKETYFC